MSRFQYEKYIFPILLLVLAYPFLSVLLPICLPFLAGLALAAISEPVVRQLQNQMRLRRSMATAIGVTAVLIVSFAAVTVLLTLLMRQLARLSQFLPDVANTIQEGSLLLEAWLLSLAEKAPAGFRDTLVSGIEKLLSSNLLENALRLLPQAATNLLGHLSQGMLTTVTAIISAYMFSFRLPALRLWISHQLPTQWEGTGKLCGFRKAIGRWLLAEGKLALVALVFLSIGFMLLRLPNALLLAGLITLVDILPVLGVGTVLVPWSLVCFLQSDVPKAVGLLAIFVVIWLVRSILEPKLVGKELGLDPLITLAAIYAGFQLAGLWGLLLAPLVAITLQELHKSLRQ